MTNGFERLLVDLIRESVHFIVVGGLAVAYCGYVRATDDLDLLVEASEENIHRLLRVLREFGEGAARELDRADFTTEEGAIRVVEDFPVDIFTQMSGHTYADLLPMTATQSIHGDELRHLNVDGLILLKKDSLRPKDQLDVQALRQIQDASSES